MKFATTNQTLWAGMIAVVLTLGAGTAASARDKPLDTGSQQQTAEQTRKQASEKAREEARAEEKTRVEGIRRRQQAVARRDAQRRQAAVQQAPPPRVAPRTPAQQA